MRGLVKVLVFLFLIGCQKGCQPAHAPVSGDASPVPAGAGSAVGLGAVQAVGSCDAMLSVEVLLGPVVLPVVLRAETRADAAGATTGHVGVDVAGILTARCAISPASPDGACAVGGLAPRLLGAPAEVVPGGQP
jgi:hypothetical protein